MASADRIRLALPFDRAALARLEAGDSCLLTGPLYTLHRAGVAATVGKGRRSSEVRDACRATGSVYFVACGGAAAYLAKCVASSETVAYDDLGTEALRRIDVVDFPVFVGVDVRGRDVYDLV